jgi:hypothetical protein
MVPTSVEAVAMRFARRAKMTIGQPSARASVSRLAVGVHCDRMPDELEHRTVRDRVRVGVAAAQVVAVLAGDRPDRDDLALAVDERTVELARELPVAAPARACRSLRSSRWRARAGRRCPARRRTRSTGRGRPPGATRSARGTRGGPARRVAGRSRATVARGRPRRCLGWRRADGRGVWWVRSSLAPNRRNDSARTASPVS